jgi:hypothetical protein
MKSPHFFLEFNNTQQISQRKYIMLLFIGVKTDKNDIKMFNGIVLISISGVYAFRSNRCSQRHTRCTKLTNRF